MVPIIDKMLFPYSKQMNPQKKKIQKIYLWLWKPDAKHVKLKTKINSIFLDVQISRINVIWWFSEFTC